MPNDESPNLTPLQHAAELGQSRPCLTMLLRDLESPESSASTQSSLPTPAIQKKDSTGVAHNGTVFLTAGSKVPELVVTGQEVMHTLERSNPELYGKMSDLVTDYLKNGVVAKQRSKQAMSIDPEVDSMASAIAKLGGIQRDGAIGRLQLAPEELNESGMVGNLSRPLFHKFGMSLDRMGEQLAELGYIRTDEHGKHDQADFEDKLADVAGGIDVHTPNGIMRRAQEAHEQAMQEVHARDEKEYDTIEHYADREPVESRDAMDTLIDRMFDQSNTKETLSDKEIDAHFGEPESSRVSEIDSGRHADEGDQGNQAAPGGGSFELGGESRAEGQARLDEAQRQSQQAKTDEQREIDARQDASADNFRLGQSAEDGLAGREPLFSKKREFPDVLIAHVLGSAAAIPAYKGAKAGSVKDGVEVAKILVTPDLLMKIQQMAGDKNPIIQPVNAIEATGKNRVPLTAAAMIERELGLESGTIIIQSSSPKRTGMSGIDRVFSRPVFEGEVEPGRAYILLDDTVTQGGTFASLTQHIEAGGGKVLGTIALTGKQYSSKLSLSDVTLAKLRSQHGDLEAEFETATGYRFDALTESEARSLANFKPADAVRDRILQGGREAGAQGSVESSVTDANSNTNAT